MIALIMAIENDNDRFFMSEIYVRYEKYIKKFVYDYVKNWETAEDCVHDVVVKIINNLENFRDASETEQTRLVCIYSRSVAISFYRKTKTEKNLFEEMPEDQDLVDIRMSDRENSPEQLVMSEENNRILAQLVNDLPDIYRDVVVLKYGHNMNCADIAHALDVKESVVSTRLMRARQMLLQSGREYLYD